MISTLIQDLLVYALVALCALYSLWAFSPATLKQRVARALVKLSPRLAASRRLQKMTLDAGGCGSGCSSCGPTKPVREHKIQLFRRH